MDATTLKNYLADEPPTVVNLEIKPHFEALTENQKLYAHYLSRAGFLGTRIILRQVSPESEPIFDFILALHNACGGDWAKLQAQAGIKESELRSFLEYATQFLGNIGNYKAIGDAKFVPRISKSALTALASTSPEALMYYSQIKDAIFASDKQSQMHLGYYDEGHLTTYFPDSSTITKEEITLVGESAEARDFSLINTRLRKTRNGDFEILIASASKEIPSETVAEWGLEGKLSGKQVKLVYGDYTDELTQIATEIDQAVKHAADDTQRKMLEKYADTFRTGSVESFKDSQRYWIKDTGPIVESNIGFIENYRDPHGVRAEWEGWVAMVNQERTKAFSRLVAGAEDMIPKLPWPADFETDKFLKPDFTSLEVLSIAGSMVPAGINIPNFDDIRQNEGFKNVSLGNVLSAKAPDEKMYFIADADVEVYKTNRDGAFEVQVGIHELLGHGTGKLLQETSPGKYNFDANNPPVSPVTQKPITTWYKPGQTWGSVFGSISSSYEECRAECVAMALSCDFATLQAFGFGDGRENLDGPAGDVLYAAWLQMARAGLLSLEFYDPSSRKWGQAHAQARFSILRCFLDDAGPEFARLQYTSSNDLSDLHVTLNRQKILTHGRPAVEKYLQKLHIYKTTADFENGRQLYDSMTAVDDEWWGGKIRNEVLKRKVPRKVFVQSNTVIDAASGQVGLKEYEPTLEGMIASWAERKV